MLKAYKYRIYPTKKQQVLIAKHMGCSRWVYNYGLNKKIKEYTVSKKHLSRFDIQADLPKLKKEEGTQWLSEVNAQSLQATIKYLDAAFIKFFKEKTGFPKFKSKKNNKQSFAIPQNIELDLDEKKVFIPKFKEGIQIVIDRHFIGEIRQATISKVPSGKYFISVLVENNVENIVPAVADIETAIGIDLGIKDFIITSNGLKVPNPAYLKKSLKRLSLLQRRHSRKQKGSKNKNKQRIKVAKQYEKISNQRTDFLQKLSTTLIRDNQANTFCMEDLNVKGMMKNHNLARSISDVSWSKFVEMMKYKCEWYGKNLIFIGRFEASSKTCSCCGEIKRDLKLADRTWTCSSCHTEHDRDINAANNILSFGFHEKNKVELETTPKDINKIKIGQELPEFTSVENGVHPRKRVSRSKKQKSKVS